MPELPEVKKYAENLNQFIQGQQLFEIKIHSGRYLKKPPDEFDKFNKPLDSNDYLEFYHEIKDLKTTNDLINFLSK